MKRKLIKEVIEEGKVGDSVVVKGWVRSIRKSKEFGFLILNDGSCIKNLQIVFDTNISNFAEVKSLLTGSSVKVEGKLVESQGQNQSIELSSENIEIYGTADSSYPLQKKSTSLEFLRENAHLRCRTNLFGAVFRIRHQLAMATHEFFHKRNYFYLNSPILTGVDAEGAGEMFNVTTLPLYNLPKNEKNKVDYKQDYFEKEASLCVTGQLEAECFAMGLGAVYTFGPTFRSENSNTARHLAEFWMIEPEVAFADLEEIADVAADYVKHLINSVLENCEDDLRFICSRQGSDSTFEEHVNTLKHVSGSNFTKVTYTDAISILNESSQTFEFKPDWGVDLQTEHERYLTENHFKGPVIVTDYPRDIKAFYMKQNEDGKTVRAMDILVPGVGELIGGSQREENLDKLSKRMKELKMKKAPLWWYMDLRKYGTVPHSGFGLGFERAIMYITGISNIRDVIAFPRTPGNLDF